jgi:hypothetical protein
MSSNWRTTARAVLVLTYIFGHAIAQTVSHRLPTAAARVQAQVRSCGICGGQSGTGTGFLWVLQLPLPILIPPTAPHSLSSITQGWYNKPNSGRCTKWTQSHITPRKKATCLSFSLYLVLKDVKNVPIQCLYSAYLIYFSIHIRSNALVRRKLWNYEILGYHSTTTCSV